MKENEFLLCSTYEMEFPGKPDSDYLYMDAQVFKKKPSRNQADTFYNFLVPAMELQTGTLVSIKHNEVEFEK